jgi:hypothetical protein
LGNRLFPFSEWASDSPDSTADGGQLRAQLATGEPDSDIQTLDQEIEGSNPSSPATPQHLALTIG